MHGAAYTAEDIKKYIRGEMSPAEMHALEKAALDDPFLADAIEGIEQSSRFEADVAELKKRINERTRKKPLTGIYWKAAAVLLVMVTAVALVLIIDDKQPKRKEAVLAKVENRNDTVIGLQRKDTPAAFKQQEEKKDDRRRIITPPAPVSKEEEIVVENEPEQQLAAIPQAETAINIADSVQRTPRGDTLKTRELQGNVAGAQVSKNVRVDEVAVVGYSTKKKEAKKSAASSIEERSRESIVPEGGWEAFDQYLNNNKKIASVDSVRKGIQIISFTIDKNSRPQNFKIRKSLSPAHDAESIRLLENGPDWKIIEGKKRKVRLEIIF